MKHLEYIQDQAILRRLVHLYELECDKEYQLPKKNTGVYDDFLKSIILNKFFNFRWIMDLNINQVYYVAKQFKVEIPDQYVSEVFSGGIKKNRERYKGEPVIEKMWNTDKIRYLYQNLEKFVIKLNEKSFEKRKVKY
jgi:hypothetical protein